MCVYSQTMWSSLVVSLIYVFHAVLVRWQCCVCHTLQLLYGTLLYFTHLVCWCSQGLIPDYSWLFNVGTFLSAPRSTFGTYDCIPVYVAIHWLDGSWRICFPQVPSMQLNGSGFHLLEQVWVNYICPERLLFSNLFTSGTSEYLPHTCTLSSI